VSYGMMGRGDYGVYRGDPGLFGFIKKVGGGLISRIIKGSPAGMIGSALVGAVRKGRQRPRRSGGLSLPVSMPGMPNLLAPARGTEGAFWAGTGMRPGKRRRMNVANPKALRKAIRRQAGFVKLARKALKGSGYTITSRGASRGRRTGVHISESGPGSVRVSR